MRVRSDRSWDYYTRAGGHHLGSDWQL